MNDIKITVVLPTYNRSECIDYFLMNAVAKYAGDFFIFEIHDSSDDDKTAELVSKYNEGGHKNRINYFRYPSSMNGDDKTHYALSHAEGEYTYLIGDGILPDFEKLERFLKSNAYENYDVIGVFGDGFRYNKHNKQAYNKGDVIYKETDQDALLINHMVCFTLYGVSIVRQEVIKYIDKENLFSKFSLNGRYSFAYCCSLFESIKAKNYNVGISFSELWKINPKKTGNWAHGENFYRIFYVEFLSDIDSLSYKDEMKNEALKNIGKYHFSYHGIVRYRLKNVFTIKLLKKYKPYVKRINNHYWFMWLVAFIPKWLLYMFYVPLRCAKRGIKKLLKRC